MKEETNAIRGQIDRTAYREHSVPMFLTSSFIYKSAEQAERMFAGEETGDIYSRFTNPNTTELINKFCKLEEAEDGVVTASGMAAVFSTLASHLKSGDHLVACSSLFGNTNYIIKNILPTWGIDHTLVSADDQNEWEEAFQPNTKMVLIETPTNPGLEILDLQWLSELCKKHNAIFCVDNCFATPILQKPMLFGADLSIHSATKWTDGQGRVLGGAVVGKKEYIQPIFDFLRRTGPSLSPFNAWILSKSLETLGLRMERHSSNALRLAEHLEAHEKVRRVRYPFLSSHPQYELAKKQMKYGGGIITIDIGSAKKEVFAFINRLTIPSITANLGDSRTIITHPATTTHSKLSKKEQEASDIYMSTIRLSIGLEDVEDLIEDMDQALNQLR